MLSYSTEALETAKREGLHLVKIELNGRHAKKGTMSLAANCGPETAAKIAELLEYLCDAEKRKK